MLIAYLALGLLAGALYSAQGPVNARLAEGTGATLTAALISFGTGFAVLSVAALVTRTAIPLAKMAGAVPWWAYGGGAMGAVIVFSAALVVARTGTVLWIAVFLAGNFLASLLIDHFGLLGLERRPMSVARIGGVALVAAGAILILINRD